MSIGTCKNQVLKVSQLNKDIKYCESTAMTFEIHFYQTVKCVTLNVLSRCGSTDVDGPNDCHFMSEYSELCSVITNTSGPFTDCHLHSDPQPFFTSCVYDLCLYTPANGMLCSAIAAYERTCSVLGLNFTDWRSALQCGMFILG